MGIKERRTKILLALFLLSDNKLSPVTLDKKIQEIFDINLNQKTKGTLSGMLRENVILKVQNAPENKNYTPVDFSHQVNLPQNLDGRSSKETTNRYQLTQTGFAELCLKFPFFRFLREAWDGKWRVLSYEIPEKKRELRDRLRREVAGWGLGPWHRSFWLTPHPIIENLRQLVFQKEEEKYIQAFESSHVFGNRELLIEKVWQKTELDQKYRNVFRKWHAILSGQEEKTVKMKKVVAEYVEILKIDPGLPKELIGEKWIGFEAYNIFKEIKSILLT